jgi:hypothetical protein
MLILSEDFEPKYDEIFKNQLSLPKSDALKIILEQQIAISREQQTLLDTIVMLIVLNVVSHYIRTH